MCVTACCKCERLWAVAFSDWLMILVFKGRRISIHSLTIFISIGSKQQDFVADYLIIFSTSSSVTGEKSAKLFSGCWYFSSGSRMKEPFCSSASPSCIVWIYSLKKVAVLLQSSSAYSYYGKAVDVFLLKVWADLQFIDGLEEGTLTIWRFRDTLLNMFSLWRSDHFIPFIPHFDVQCNLSWQAAPFA